MELHHFAFKRVNRHVIILQRLSDIPLYRGMQNLSFRYTRWINWREKRIGHLFQGRYKAVLVDGDSYLLELVRYIHLNPVRAGMVKSLGDHPWSSHSAYLGTETFPWLTTEWVLGQFGTISAQILTGYERFMTDGMGEGHRPEFHGKGEADSRLLGDDIFLEKCLAEVGEIPCQLDVQDIVAAVCSAYGIDEPSIKSPSQDRISSEARAVVGWLARELSCSPLSEVGTYVNRDIGSISSGVRRLTERMSKNPALAAQVWSLKVGLENKLGNLEA